MNAKIQQRISNLVDEFCVKVATKHELTRKMSLKRWEMILFSQIPKILHSYYKEETGPYYLDDTNLTRKTANNAAAWIMVKYETYFIHENPADYYNGRVDFHEEMRDALGDSYVHPADKLAEYFSTVLDDDEEYETRKAEYECAKKIYASQYPLIQS